MNTPDYEQRINELAVMYHNLVALRNENAFIVKVTLATNLKLAGITEHVDLFLTKFNCEANIKTTSSKPDKQRRVRKIPKNTAEPDYYIYESEIYM